MNRSDDEVEKGYCVYIHKDELDGTPFYVDKGQGARASNGAERDLRLCRELLRS